MAKQSFYTTFTDRYRGPRDMVKSRLEAAYLPFIESLKHLYANGNVLDLGCGRGEWLELLQAHGFVAHGIDLDEGMLADCQERGLSVEKQDAIGALLVLADESQAIVSGFHIIEHIPFEALEVLMREARRVLKPGGLLILETPNPENILVSTSGFYLDPTHQRPIPLHLLAFLSEYTGFSRVKVLRLHDSPEIIVKPNITLLDVLGGVSPDYAIIAQQPGSDEQMEMTGQPFITEKGLMLEALTAQYDHQIVHTKACVVQAEARITQAEARITQTEARITQAEVRAAQVEVRAAQAEMERQAMLASRSWQITRPLRYFANVARQLRTRMAMMQCKTQKQIGPFIIFFVLGAIRFAQKSSVARTLVSRFPRLKARLRSAMKSVRHPVLNEPIASIRQRWQQEENCPIPIVGAGIAKHRGNCARQLFVDISAIVEIDAKTGIQRVTRSILKEFFDNPPDGYKVEPVYATPFSNGYRYARQYAARVHNQICDGKDEYIDYYPGDMFLGVDLQHKTLIAQRDYLMGLRRSGVKIYFVVYDLLPILMPHFFVLEPEIHQIWLEAIAGFDGALCISRAVADDLNDWLKKYGRQRLCPFKVDWFHLGADIESSVPTFGLPADADHVLHNIGRAPAFLMVGTVEPRKGHRQTLGVFEQLWAQGSDVNLVIVGQQGWDVDDLIYKLRHHCELGKHLFWLNYISDEYLEKIYADCVCLIVASEGEGFGLPLIEAARHQLPIIARDIPVFREVAGEHATYFDGLHPDGLRTVIEGWLVLNAAGKTPQSSDMRWLTWAESAAQLKSKLFGYPLREEWYDAQQPEVSLIVLNYNKPEMTIACIESLWEHTQGYRYEIILVDNGSEPANFWKLANLKTGARIVRLEINRFFGEGNNIGFEATSGRYVVFLNNDIAATPGWLVPLIQRMEQDAGIGATGPKLISSDYRLQEAGAEIRVDGSDNRYGRGADPDDPAYATQRDVMYISAAALAMRRETFEQVLGFDLCYEPAYYEDVDLCLKIRQLNLRVTYCPDSCIVHYENATSGEYADKYKLKTLTQLNQQRFLARWQPVLAGDTSTVPGLIPSLAPPLQHREDWPSILLYTPYNLVPGGGERYLLTIAAGLAEVANVTLATPHPFSRLRLRTMGRELSLNLDAVHITTLEQATNSAVYDVSIVMGNEALPGIAGKGKYNIYICQFPFPVTRQILDDRREYADDYQQVVVYSPFVQRHYVSALHALGRPLPKITVVSPPAVLAVATQGGTKKDMVLGVGRFFTGGHAKRQDIMIEAFRKLVVLRPEAELHLAGSLSVEEEFRAYFVDLQHKAEGLRIFFHPNISPQQLEKLYADASIYWHLGGYGVDEDSKPHRCEHFGITVVEAMSAGCIPIVVNRGGPPETVTNGVTGYVFETVGELVKISARILSLPSDDADIVAMRAAAIEASRRYSPEHFIAEIRDLIGSAIVPAGTSPTKKLAM